jgi:ArsR family transcriptional regulator, lead/cadmium/zinc/bismuth-responsive transcriptional repressor
MHLVRQDRRIIDADHHVCDAIAAVSDPQAIQRWATIFALLGDPTRLALLISIHHAGWICVSDLATATALKPATVSQALRLLRQHGAVTANRDGRLVRYALANHHLARLIDCITKSDNPLPIWHPLAPNPASNAIAACRPRRDRARP